MTFEQALEWMKANPYTPLKSKISGRRFYWSKYELNFLELGTDVEGKKATFLAEEALGEFDDCEKKLISVYELADGSIALTKQGSKQEHFYNQHIETKYLGEIELGQG